MDRLLDESFEYLKTKLPLYQRTEDKLRSLGKEYLDFSNKHLKTVYEVSGGKEGYYKSLDSFVKLSMDYLSLQIQTKKTGKYKYSSYEEVRREVYDNPAVMGDYYLEGLLLSQVFWVNHYHICQFLLEFVSELTPQMRGIDLPCGSGIHSALLLSKVRPHSHLLCDMCHEALSYSQKLIPAYSGIQNLETMPLDARKRLPFENQSLDYICCGELLEHLEDPMSLMKEFGRVLKETGKLYLTTVAFAAALDHIYMFESAQEIETFIKASQFQIRKQLILPVSGRPEEIHMKCKPLNCAYVLSK